MCPVDKLCEDIMQDIADAGYRPAMGYELRCQWVSHDPRLETQEYRRSLVAWLHSQPVGSQWEACKALPVHGNPNGMHLRFLEPMTRTDKPYRIKKMQSKEIEQ